MSEAAGTPEKYGRDDVVGDEGRGPHAPGPWQSGAVVVGMVVGAGIFRSAAAVGAALGSAPAIYAAWLAGGLVALAGALCYAELSTAFPHAGGDYRFLKEAYGDTIAFLFGWSRFTVIFTASAAMLAFVGTDYLATLVPMGSATRAAVAVAAVLLLGLLNLRGLAISVRGEVVLVALVVVALLALGGAGAWLRGSGAPAPATMPNHEGMGTAMIYVMLAYGGFNDAATLSAEVRRPRDITYALVGGMAAVTALYLIANWAYLTALGPAGLAASAAPAAAVMRRALGPAGEIAMVAAVVVATAAILNALFLVGGRTLTALAGDTPALARLGRWDRARGVAPAAVRCQVALTLPLILWGATTPAGFATMVDYMAPVYWLFLTLSGAALPILRLRRADVPRPYRAPLAPLLSLVFTAAAGAIFVASMVHVGVAGCAVSAAMLAIGMVTRAALSRHKGAGARSEAHQGASASLEI
ncbi:APC family permease [Sphingomonas sp. BK235]|uniref:APC family permease n=1 Tax=Sphingomonas sp. BK235 TaxID=2512131 RepID=UPI0010D97039|nr:APC family permease [Sphingomonas sp. BK235]TCP35944.1 amino acid/polyamine/organocation transporter (APC superfamily) [Sphingomonas sp. BK235]